MQMTMPQALFVSAKKATLSFEVAWACNAEDESYVELLGDKGGVKVGENSGVSVIHTEENGRPASLTIKYDPSRDRFVAELQKFVDAIKGEGLVAATGEEGLVAMRLLESIYKSSDEDREIVIAE